MSKQEQAIKRAVELNQNELNPTAPRQATLSAIDQVEKGQMPSEWKKHLAGLKPILGQVKLANGAVVAEITGKGDLYHKSKNVKNGRTFEALILAPESRALETVWITDDGFFAVEARVSIVARPLEGRSSAKRDVIKDYVDITA